VNQQAGQCCVWKQTGRENCLPCQSIDSSGLPCRREIELDSSKLDYAYEQNQLSYQSGEAGAADAGSFVESHSKVKTMQHLWVRLHCADYQGAAASKQKQKRAPNSFSTTQIGEVCKTGQQ